MDEHTFWIELEFRVCAEFAGMPERRRRYWWCDGFLPRQYQLDSREPKITGQAWMDGLHPEEQELWQFTLFLDKPYASRDEINWAGLLPPEGVTCWVAIDEAGKQLQLEPTAAISDFPISN